MKYIIVILCLAFVSTSSAQDLTVTTAEKVQAMETKDIAKVSEWDSIKKGLVVFDDKTNIITMTTNRTTPDKSWRLVHDGKVVISKFECSGITESIYTIFVAKTEAEIQAKIKELKLIDKEEIK